MLCDIVIGSLEDKPFLLRAGRSFEVSCEDAFFPESVFKPAEKLLVGDQIDVVDFYWPQPRSLVGLEDEMFLAGFVGTHQHAQLFLVEDVDDCVHQAFAVFLGWCLGWLI